MSPFYYTCLIILMLSSSAIAMPPPLGRQKIEPLIGSKDVRLKGSLWGPIIWSETPNDIMNMKWPGDAQCLDYALRFVETSGAGVQQVEISKVQRKLRPRSRRGRMPQIIEAHEDYEYAVVRREHDHRRPAERVVVLEPKPINQCRPYLHDSYWARNADILGKANSGNIENRGDIIHIQWKTIDGVEVPYVIFNPKLEDKKGKTLLKAQDSYKLNGVEAAVVNDALVKDDHLQKDWESAALLGNTDMRLINTLWSRVTFKLATDMAETKWTNDAQYLDDVLSFRVDAGLRVDGLLSVGGVTFSRIKRQLQGKSSYSVVRPHEGSDDQDQPAERVVLLSLSLNDKCRPHLDDTYWGLNPEILGKESSGRDQDWGHIIHIKWKSIGPTSGAEFPCVTFMPTEKLRIIILKAKESFELNEQEALVPGHMWLTGFRSPREPLLTEEILYDTYRWP